ncbi:protein methyltransferase [Comamonas serinivorans]|uniref:Protein methyltransferase n=1 Tax=Comamonas serinivorans TaxID=1082851 RepID=A0A1Y0ENF8_9BURK|nr:50S ribosomal protein L11 methyltransferase [Comamonas serinivorans]ARU04951.1 protein methyltransferase [Comamonas serinivorans]
MPVLVPRSSSELADALQQALGQLLPDARLQPTALPAQGGTPASDLALWLIDPANMQRPFDAEETRRILHEPPYWCFCWASGLALARWLHAHPEQVRGKRVLDFGAGSGIAGIAAAHAGAAEVIACDLDPLALAACRANAALNGVALGESSDFFTAPAQVDVLLAADVLYDRENLPLLDAFVARADHVIVADSRVRDFRHARYRRTAVLDACTWPDLGEPDEFRHVSLYESTRA